jgi:hypothetical protein
LFTGKSAASAVPAIAIAKAAPKTEPKTEPRAVLIVTSPKHRAAARYSAQRSECPYEDRSKAADTAACTIYRDVEVKRF